MQTATAVNLLGGFSNGYTYALTKHKEEEIKQGKNYILSGFSLAGQVGCLCSMIQIINQAVPPYPLKLLVTIANNLTPLIAAFAAPLGGAIKMGVYEPFAKGYNHVMKQPNFAKSNFAYLHFPEKVSQRTVRMASFIAEHGGNILRAAMLTSALALIALGNAAYGGALLVAIGYEAIDSMGYVPRRVSLFMETYMPTITNIGMLLTGIPIVKIFSAIALCTFSPSFNRFLHQKIDTLIRDKFPGVEGPTLKEFDAPVIEKNNMTYDEIQKILDDDYFIYRINPAHCSKPAIDLDSLPRDANFNKYLSLFDKIDWESKHDYLKSKLKKDERFMGFLEDKFPDVDKLTLFNNFDKYIKELATKEDLSPAEYTAAWTRKQMVILRDLLQGKRRVKGSQQDLDESIKICKIILPHLSSLPQQNEAIEDLLAQLKVDSKLEIKDPILKLKLAHHFKLTDINGNKLVELFDENDNSKSIELEEALLKLSQDNLGKIKNALSNIKNSNRIELEDSLAVLAVEGGDYCGRGIKRVANDLLDGILESHDLFAVQDGKKQAGDPMRTYENKILQALQTRRKKIVQDAYKTMLIQMPNVITNDTHGFDIYRLYLSMGFYPLTDYERNNIGIAQLLLWETYFKLRLPMYEKYKWELDDVVKENIYVKKEKDPFNEYIMQFINKNKALTETQKEELSEKFTEQNNGKWTEQETYKRFHRLLFTKIGVHLQSN